MTTDTDRALSVAEAYMACRDLVREAVAWRRRNLAAIRAGEHITGSEPDWRSWYERAEAAVDVRDAPRPEPACRVVVHNDPGDWRDLEFETGAK